jgi:hypothetical protein
VISSKPVCGPPLRQDCRTASVSRSRSTALIDIQRHWQPALALQGILRNCYWTLIGPRFRCLNGGEPPCVGHRVRTLCCNEYSKFGSDWVQFPAEFASLLRLASIVSATECYLDRYHSPHKWRDEVALQPLRSELLQGH